MTRVKRFTEWRLEWEPGSRFEYHATAAHWVLAELIERLSGYDFRDFIEARVCAPNGLPRLLGLQPEEQDDIAPAVPLGAAPADSRTHHRRRLVFSTARRFAPRAFPAAAGS